MRAGTKSHTGSGALNALDGSCFEVAPVAHAGSPRRQAPRLACTAVAALLVALGAAEASAEPRLRIVAQGQRVCAGTSPDPNVCDPANVNFGRAVSIDGDTAVIGASGTLAGASDALYLWVRAASGSWVRHPNTPQLLSPAAELNVGSALVISRDVLLAGAQSTASGVATGTAYVYSRSGTAATAAWGTTPVQLPSPNANNTTDRYGEAVALSADGNVAVVGARANAGSGAAYVFMRTGATWSTGFTLTQPGTRTAGAGFGTSVAVDGNWIFVGAPNLEQVFTFERSNQNVNDWVHRSTLNAPVPDENFGAEIALSGDRALVATPFSDSDSGRAYFYARSGGNWTSSQPAVTAPSVNVGDSFGSSVALFGKTALIGAEQDDELLGAAHLFASASGHWLLETPSLGGSPTPESFFGGAVDLSERDAIVGATEEHCSVASPCDGGAYIFSVTQIPAPVAALGDGSRAALATLMAGCGLVALGRRKRYPEKDKGFRARNAPL
jgi:hypothetical protein